MELVDLSR